MCLETKWVKNAKKSFSHSRAKKTFYRHIKTFRKPTTFNFVVDDNDVDRNDRIVFEETGQASKPDFVEPVRAQPRLRRHQAHRLAKPASLVSHHFWGSGREATFLGEVL